MPFSLIIAVVLAQADVAPSTPVETGSPASPGLSSEHVRLLGFSAAAVALGAGAGACSWADRDGGFGRACAITTGTLGTALLAASLGALIASKLYPMRSDATTLGEAAGEVVDNSFSAIGIAVVSTVSGLVGLAVGAIASVFATAPPGTPRGVFGVAGGGVMIATSISVLFLAW